MKVGTDGVLLGAWADVKSASKILDIGTGSGLISLMLAQRSTASITAIDIDKDACNQAKINADNTIWNNRIEIIQSDLMAFNNISNEQFDLIVSNPPYFKNSLQTPEIARTTARHATTDFHNEIIISSLKMLTGNGKLCLILPINEGNECIAFAKKNELFCNKKTTVFPKSNSAAKRILIELSRQNSPCIESQLTIESEIRHSYTEDFKILVKDFYLKL